MVTAYIVARSRGYPTEPFPGFVMVAHLLAVALPGLLLIAIIFGGVRSGVFTATESSCIAVLYALLITLLVYRQMSWRDFVHATQGAVRTTAMVLLIIGTAAAFSWLMAFLKVPASLVIWMKSVADDPLTVLLLLNVLMLVLGTFMDMGPTIIICTPIFLPVAQAYGVDPVHFGVIMILNFGIGLNTPPVGAVQFVACAVGKIIVWEAMRSIWPFYGAGIVVLGLVTYIPAISLWLPERVQIGVRHGDRHSRRFQGRAKAETLRRRRFGHPRSGRVRSVCARPEAADGDPDGRTLRRQPHRCP